MPPFVKSLEQAKNSDTMEKGLLSSGNINSDCRIKFFFPFPFPSARKIPFFIEIFKKCIFYVSQCVVSKFEYYIYQTNKIKKNNEEESRIMKIIPKKLTLQTKLEIIFLNTNHLHENLRKMHKRNKI